jgi:hypothetical protein
MAVTTVYANSTNNVLANNIYQSTWDLAHDAASATIYPPANNNPANSGGFRIGRCYLDFDLSAVSEPDETDFVRIYVYVYSHGGHAPTNGVHKADLHASEGRQAIPVEEDDFGDQLAYTTTWGHLAYDDMTNDQYNYIELNSTGIAAINWGGTQKFCLRVWADIGDTAPSAGGENDSVVYWAQQKGTIYRPYLSIEGYKQVWPGVGTMRVTGIRHLYRPGYYRMMLTLGSLHSAPLVPMLEGKPEVDEPTWLPPWWEPPEVWKTPPSEPMPWEPPEVWTTAAEPTAGPQVPSYWGGMPPGGARQLREEYMYKYASEGYKKYWEAMEKYEAPYGAGKTYPGAGLATPPAKSLYRKLTPWSEEQGETFGSWTRARLERMKKLFMWW